VANYFLILFIFPPTVIWYDENLKGRWCPCQKPKTEVETIQVTKINEHEHGKEAKFGRIEMFFGGIWNDTVNKLKVPIMAAFICWVITDIILIDAFNSPVDIDPKIKDSSRSKVFSLNDL
jgi:hypothetical protein